MKLRLSRAPWTLRRRLVVSVVALFTILSVIVGGISVLVLYSNLTAPINQQLQQSANFIDHRDAPGSGASPNGGGGGINGLAPGSITATYAIGTGISGQKKATFSFGSNVSDASLTAAQLAPLKTITKSDSLSNITIPGLGEFRVIRTSKLSIEVLSSDGTVLKQTTGYRYYAEPLAQTNSTLGGFALALGGISLAGILLVAFATWFIVSYALRPLRRVASTATEVASMPLDRGDVDLSVRVPSTDTDTRTEVGQVGAAFNTMLGHVDNALKARQASESKVRQFVADASHELRTPLASIRGYAELTRRGNYDLPADVTHSLGRVESEAVRMTSLVEDLLLLARLDAGREIEPAPLDLSLLLVDCVGDAHVAGDDHEWELELPDEPITIAGDSQRIHQVIANLLTNARVHTPAGTRVVTELSEIEVAGVRNAIITVTDDGPGIPEQLQPQLFERFARGDSSRARATGSTGLGLAIVSAVVEAHGGSVTAASEPGHTVFTVTLPAANWAAPAELPVDLPEPAPVS
jgi:two-component system OmpR family sensor kinase